MTHTKGKWEVENDKIFQQWNNKRIVLAETKIPLWHENHIKGAEEQEANAHRIVHCINVHDELLSWARIGLGYSRMLQNMSIDFDEEESKLLDNYEQAIKHAEVSNG